MQMLGVETARTGVLPRNLVCRDVHNSMSGPIFIGW